ncbi:retrovirus-related pol polyprotein from transposon TNT 1-94 [Tanacetum coccineum]
MSTQQDIYAAGSENRPPMLNKENYVPWSSRLLRYAKSRPNGKLIYNSIMNGPYVRRMIPEPGDPARTVPVPETFHEQTDDELTEAKIKQMKVDDQAIQTILLGLPEDIYHAVDSCETAQEIWLRVQQMMKGSDIGIQEKKAKLFNEWERFTSTDGESIESYYHRFSKLMNDFKRNKHFPEKIASNLKFLNNLQPEWSRHVTIVHQTKDLHTADYTQLYDFLKYNQKEVDELRAERLAKTQDPLALMANSNNSFKYPVFHPDLPSSSTYIQQPLPNNNNYNPQPSFNQNYMQQPMPNLEDITDPTAAMNTTLALMAKAFKLNYSTPTNNNQRISSNPRNRQIAQPGNQVVQNAVQNPSVQNVRNQNGVIVVPGIAHQNGNGNVVAARAEGNANGNNEAGIQLQAEEFDLIAAVADLDEIEEVNANCILMANLQQASTSGTQTDKAPVYDLDGSAKVQLHDKCYNDEIFNMFTQEEQYTELLEPIPEPHQVPQNDSNVISEVPSVEQGGGTVEQHPVNVEETRAYHESLFHNFAVEVEKVNSVNRKVKEKNAELTTELARYKNQERCFEISQEKYDKLERSFKGKINRFFSSRRKKGLKSDFKIREDELLDKQIQLENKVKELDNILVKTGQSIQMMHMLSPKPDSFYHTEQKMASGYQNLFYLKQARQKQQSLYNGKVLLEKHDPSTVYDSEETLELAQESLLKMQLLNKEIKPANYTKINHLSGVFVSQTAMSREELYLSNTFNMANVSKSISIPNEEFSNDTTPSVAHKFLNEIPQKVNKTHDLSNPVTSNSVPTTEESKVFDNDKVIAPRMFRINPFKNPRVEKFVPNKPSKASVRTNPITASQPHVIIKKAVNSNSNGFSSTGVDNTTKTRRPQPRSNTKNDRVPSASKSSRIMNKEVDVEDHPRNLQVSTNKKPLSSECNNIKLAIRNDKSEIVCAMYKQCLITANHDVCVLNYVNGMNSHSMKRKANVSKIANQMTHKARVWKPKNVGSKERLASPKPSQTRLRLRWSPTGKMFDIKGKIIASSEFNGDNACTFNHLNFDTINDLAINDLVTGLPKFKYHKEHLCPSCEQGKSKRASHPPKPVPNLKQKLHLLHMDLCGPMRIASINGKRTDNGIEFKNQVLQEYFKSNRITHQASFVCTPQQNGVVERRNRTSHLNFDTINDLVRNDLVTGLPKFKFYKDHLCPSCEQGKIKRASHPPKPIPNSRREPDNGTKFKNQVLQEYFKSVGISHQASSVRTPQQNDVVERRNHTLVKAARTLVDFFSCTRLYLLAETMNRKDIEKLGAKGDIGLFIGYSDNSGAYKSLSTKGQRKNHGDNESCGQPLAAPRTISVAQAPQVLQTSTETTTTADTAPTPTNSLSQGTSIPSSSQIVDELETTTTIGRLIPVSIA